MRTAAKVGDTSLDVVATTGMTSGTKIVIAGGTKKEEFNEIVGLGSLKLKFPLKYSHEAGVTVAVTVDEEGALTSTTRAEAETTTTLPDEEERLEAGAHATSPAWSLLGVLALAQLIPWAITWTPANAAQKECINRLMSPCLVLVLPTGL